MVKENDECVIRTDVAVQLEQYIVSVWVLSRETHQRYRPTTVLRDLRKPVRIPQDTTKVKQSSTVTGRVPTPPRDATVGTFPENAHTHVPTDEQASRPARQRSVTFLVRPNARANPTAGLSADGTASAEHRFDAVLGHIKHGPRP